MVCSAFIGVSKRFKANTKVGSAFFVPIVFGGNTEVGSSFIGVSAGFKGNTKVG